jgi:dynein heavy chain
MIEKIADSILGELPPQFDIAAASVKYPVMYTESMNTVLTQELLRFNVLTITIKNSLTDLKKAIKGLVTMSSSLENTLRALFDGKVPPEWGKKSYPSLKPLGSYISDLKARLEFFKDWISRGQPEVYNLSRFYFTQSFLTGALQNFARKYTIPIDEIFFNYEVVNTPNPTRPADGILANGMFLEGAKWDYTRKVLVESDPKVLYVDCPMIWLKPATERDVYPHYECPLYKTSERRGELSTTGHSTNFVMFFWLASDLPEKHWIKRGVAMLTQLDF